jgi:mannose-1-phosphate guanylyltransferase/mannose-6-phosphate isomerase
MNKKVLEAYPILLAGGSGTRLWPVSRSLFPKQLVTFGESRSLIQETIQRLHPVFDVKKVMVVCASEHYQETAKQLRDSGLKAPDNILCEPVGRNTAPAVLLATLALLSQSGNEDAVLFIFPADHVIKNKARFHSRIQEAMQLAAKGHIVTFGIEPDYPETGYGYIEGERKIFGNAMKIKRFVEKPDLKTAETYLAAGNFFWNSGMFAFKISVILEEFIRLAPDLFHKMKTMIDAENGVSPATYQELPNISFDYAVMEHTLKGAVLPSDFGWSDIGSWKSLYDFLPKDQAGNVIKGDVITSRTKDSLVMGQSRLVVTNDLNQTVVVETPDAVFVSSVENSRDVKNIVESLKQDDRKEYQSHLTEFLKWGSLKHLDENSDFHVAVFSIYTGETLQQTIDSGCRWHCFLLKGNARLSYHDQEIDLDAFESRTLEGPGQVALKNICGYPVSAVCIQINDGS